MALAIIISFLAILLTGILLMRFHKRWLAAFNIAITNKITGRFADRLPGFGNITHVGRKSGRVYRTPVNVFQAPNGFLVALTYGRESEWVKNVLAAGRCKLETRGQRHQLTAPDQQRYGIERGDLAEPLGDAVELDRDQPASGPASERRCRRRGDSFSGHAQR